MALTFDQLSAVTQRKFVPKMVDNIFDSNPLLQRLKKNSYEKLDGGLSIMVPLNYAMVTASGWYSGAETLDTTDNEISTAAEYSWKQLYVNISLTRSDELKNSGDSQIISLTKTKTKVAEKTMADKLGTGIYSDGTDTKSIVGLRDIVDTASTVGGISQSSYSWWQAGSLDSSTTVLSLAAMQAVDNECTINSDSPSVVVTTRSIFNSYYALLQPQQRFTDSSTAKGGFSSLMFNGKPVIADSYCPSSNMFFLNEDYLALYVHKDEDMRFEPFQKPVNQNVRVAKIYWMGALGSSNNRMHGRLSAITG